MNVKITTPFIKLDQLLKFSGVADTGAFAKELILEGFVRYNGEVCLMRGKKVSPKDKVTVECDDFSEEIIVE